MIDVFTIWVIFGIVSGVQDRNMTSSPILGVGYSLSLFRLVQYKFDHIKLSRLRGEIIDRLVYINVYSYLTASP
jgi:hypothetical protein